MAKHRIITHGNSKVIDGHLEFLYEQNQNMLDAMQRMRDDVRALHARSVLPSRWQRIVNRWKSRGAWRRPS